MNEIRKEREEMRERERERERERPWGQVSGCLAGGTVPWLAGANSTGTYSSRLDDCSPALPAEFASHIWGTTLSTEAGRKAAT